MEFLDSFLDPIPYATEDEDIFCVNLVRGNYYPGFGFSVLDVIRPVFSGSYDECCDYLDNYKSEYFTYLWKDQP